MIRFAFFVLAAALTLLSTSPAFADATLVAIAVTPSPDSVLTVPVGGNAAFAAAVINAGTSGVTYLATATVEAFEQTEFTATAVNVPVTVTICQTHPAVRPVPSQHHPRHRAGRHHPHHSVFVHADGPIGNKPDYAARVVVTFAGTRPVTFPPRIVGPLATYTAASVAVKTQ